MTILIILFLIVVGLIIFFSTQSAENSNALSENISKTMISSIVDGQISDSSFDEKHNTIRSLAHIVLFFILGLITLCLLNEYTSINSSMLITFIFCICFAIFDETYQELLNKGRAFEFADLLKDWFGSLFGIGITYIIKRYRCKKDNLN